MIKFFIMADHDLPVLSHNLTKFMNGIQRNGGVVLSTDIVRDVVAAAATAATATATAATVAGAPLFTGVVFYSETRKRDE
jgi:hypothetical protein